MIHERLIGRDAERLFREQLAIANENTALAHQPDGRTDGDPFLCAGWKEAAHDASAPAVRTRKLCGKCAGLGMLEVAR